MKIRRKGALAIFLLAAMSAGAGASYGANDGTVLFQRAVTDAGGVLVVAGGTVGLQYADKFEPDRLFDGLTSTSWIGEILSRSNMAAGNGGTFVSVAASGGVLSAKTIVLKKYRLCQRCDSVNFSNSRRPTSWRLEGSNDGESWVLIHTVDADAGWGGDNSQTAPIPDNPWVEFSLAENTASYAAYRFTPTESDASVTYSGEFAGVLSWDVALSELELYVEVSDGGAPGTDPDKPQGGDDGGEPTPTDLTCRLYAPERVDAGFLQVRVGSLEPAGLNGVGSPQIIGLERVDLSGRPYWEVSVSNLFRGVSYSLYESLSLDPAVFVAVSNAVEDVDEYLHEIAEAPTLVAIGSDGRVVFSDNRYARPSDGPAIVAITFGLDGYFGAYDGEPHTVVVCGLVPGDASLAYSTDGGQSFSPEAPYRTDAGETPVRVVATRPATGETVWLAATNDAVIAIAQAANAWVAEPSLSKTAWTDGEAAAVVSNGSALFGAVEASALETTVGEYVMEFTVAGTLNYTGLQKTIGYAIRAKANPPEPGEEIVLEDFESYAPGTRAMALDASRWSSGAGDDSTVRAVEDGHGNVLSIGTAFKALEFTGFSATNDETVAVAFDLQFTSGAALPWEESDEEISGLSLLDDGLYAWGRDGEGDRNGWVKLSVSVAADEWVHVKAVFDLSDGTVTYSFGGQTAQPIRLANLPGDDKIVERIHALFSGTGCLDNLSVCEISAL